MIRKSWTKLFNSIALALVLTLITPWAVFADDLVADGDGLAPLTENASFSFGNVCANSTVEKNVLLAIKATGHPGAGNNTFANGSTVTVSAGTSTGTGLSAGNGANIVLPGDWISKPNQTLSNSSSPKVTLTTGAAPTTFSGSIEFNASGKNAKDASNLTKSQTINVSANVVSCDTKAPSLNLPADITEEATSANGAAVMYTATATDENPANPAVTCSPASGSTFVIGTSKVDCSATDAAGNEATGSFSVKVQDTKGPVFSNELPITDAIEATSGNGAVVEYTNPTAIDAVDGARTVTCSPESGSTFQLGTTTVTCSASDSRGNSSEKTFEIKVQDTTKPVLSLPQDITAEATGPDGANVSYMATANDTVDGPITPNCSPASGSKFALSGPAAISCSAMDAAGNEATGSFNVTVVDTTAPDLELPNGITVEATGPNGATVTYTASANDLVSGNVQVSCTSVSGSTFGLGETPVNCSATDAAGNQATGSFLVKVQDTTEPLLKLPADMRIAATSASGATVNYAVSATDVVDANPTVICTPASGSTFAIGTTKVNCSATDASGNKAIGSFLVTIAYNFRGFYQPVDTTTTSTIVWNTVKNGSTVPIKFEVFAGADEITSTSAVIQPLTYTQFNCTTGSADAIEELASTNGTNLRYDTTGGQFIYNWQTPKLAGKCYAVKISLTEGSSKIAYFQLK